VIRLIRAYLNSGIMSDGVVQERYQGTPQGGPITPRTQKAISSLSGEFR
jgi:RNA-directed DNA polymerase